MPAAKDREHVGNVTLVVPLWGGESAHGATHLTGNDGISLLHSFAAPEP